MQEIQKTRQEYIQALADVKGKVYQMGLRAEAAVQRALQSLLENDHALADRVMREDDDIDDMIISTVVPSLLFALQHMAVKYFGKPAIVVESGVKTGLVIKYDNPKQVGADRIVNAVAAVQKYGGPLIIIDMGTATTFCAITDKSEYLGGTIAPGLKISSEALFEKTSKLPKVEIEDPGRTICRTTAESMQSGLVYGHMGMCDYIITKMKR